jgi:hypothetical protein
MKYAKVVSIYYGMPVRSDFRITREFNGITYRFLLYFFLPVLLIQAFFVLEHFMR